MIRYCFIIGYALAALPLHAQDAISMNPFPKLVEESSEGPWGKLEHYKARLSCPPEYLSYISIPSEKTEWNFPHETIDEVKTYLLNSGLTPDQIRFLMNGTGVYLTEETLRLFPTNEVIMEMPAALRAKFYRILSKLPDNPFYRRPAFLNTANVSRYFKDSNFSVNTLQLIAQLSYPTPSGHGFFLSDIPHLLRDSGSSGDERKVMDALLRVPALMVRLNLSEVVSTGELASYWAAGFKNKQVQPIFESVIANPHVDRLDVAHLLPPLARRNLNSFPAQADGMEGRYPDWFWTCFNFFRFSPRNVYANSENFDALFASEFTKGSGPFEFGDLLLLKSKSKTIHGCIYIADEIVYTKNGADLFSPTILMKLEDVVSFHDLEGDVRLEHYKKAGAPRSLSLTPAGTLDVN